MTFGNTWSPPPRLRDQERPPQLAYRAASYGGTTRGAVIAKDRAIQSDAYERAAKALGYCMRCGCTVIPLTSQLDFCHRDLGKGMGLKTDSREGWPGCRACHEIVGRELARAVRRAVEIFLGAMTRAAVIDAGAWPKRLAKWPVDQLNAGQPAKEKERC